jgi:hypothetical protein
MTFGDMSKHDVDALIAEIGVVAAGQKLGVAALLYTYQCTISCRHCCFGCAADRPHVHIGTERAVHYLSELHRLGRVIHIAGGECMMNCSFASDDSVVSERLDVLQRAGVVGILMSACPYHQEFVPPEHVLRVRRQAWERFGRQNVWCSDAPEDTIRSYASVTSDETLLREHVRRSPPMMVGTAHRELRRFLDTHPTDSVPPARGWHSVHSGRGCAVEFESGTIWELHIDPYDNIQTNCGVILGNARTDDLTELMRNGPENANAIARVLADGGPTALAAFARDRFGYTIPERVVSKCDLCYSVRQFLRPHFPDILGPDEVYGG